MTQTQPEPPDGHAHLKHLWLPVIAIMLFLTVVGFRVDWLRDVPDAIVLPLNAWINTAMSAVVAMAQPFFRTLSWILGQPMDGLQFVLHGVPWVTITVVFVGLAWLSSGGGLAIFAGVGCLLTLVLGYWTEMLNTLALVGVSVPLSIALGFSLGTAGFLWPRTRRVLDTILDFMQTIPAFAYLIPILLLFGFGPVVGLIASAIYASPPMVRNTILGLSSVPEAQIESGQMSGATKRQLFWLVRVPGALPRLLVGVNQSTMQALSMVIIAAIIGGFDDIGWAVLTALRKAQFGQSLMAGLCIVFLAVMIDRITWGFATRAKKHQSHAAGTPPERRVWLIFGAAIIISTGLGLAFPLLREVPASSLVPVAEPLNDWLETFLLANGTALNDLKTAIFYYLMFPLKAGLENAVTPFTWGFTFTPEIKIAYWVAGAVLSVLIGRKRFMAGLVTLFVFWLSYFGMTGVSWTALTVFLCVLGYSLGGLRTASLCLFTCAFLAITGLWDLAMLSIYLCSAGVVASLVFGGIIGTVAAHSSRVSGVVRVISDTLQTMPQFVLLIPFLMFFQVGEFTALLAIIIYAIVPAMRYSEAGLRGIDPNVLEAAQQIGCTRWQMLWQVRVPLALPVLALGINQTIMFGLAMLAITALVGTQDLGQAVYVALSQADAGQGLLAGLAIALIALLSDRLIRDWIATFERNKTSPATFGHEDIG
ncbi:MAG: ABC transporter permease subunit [Pseudomonadota bacterium]